MADYLNGVRQNTQPAAVVQNFAEFLLTGGGAYTINTAAVVHGFAGASAGESSGSSVVTGSVKTDISAYATSDAGARTKVTTTGAHGLSVGQIITITNTTNYNSIYEVMEIVDANNFTIDKAWDTNDDGVGTYALPDHIVISQSGIYQVVIAASGSIATSAADCAFGIYVEKVLKHQSERKFANATDVGAWAGSGLVDVNAGDRIWYGVTNLDNDNNVTISDLAFGVHKL